MIDDRQLQKGSVAAVFITLLCLGRISLGGPVAHLGYFQKELVVRRPWCDEAGFAELFAFAQSLPSPSSSHGRRPCGMAERPCSLDRLHAPFGPDDVGS